VQEESVERTGAEDVGADGGGEARNQRMAQRRVAVAKGRCHDQTDAEWIIIIGPLRSHIDMRFGWPTSGHPIDRQGAGRPPGVLWYFQLLLISFVIS
jgi:hypothetical protein